MEWEASGHKAKTKLQALVYDILPSTTAVFSYAIGSRNLSANEQGFFCWCSNNGKLDTNNSNKKGVSFIAANKVYTSTKDHNRLNRDGTLLFFYPGWMLLMFACVLGR